MNMSTDDTARATLSANIKAAAQELGFALAGISPVQLPPHGESFARWLRDGFAGELGYMSRTEALRRDPHELVPWARSVISVGMNYYTPFARPETADNSEGWISRYAWGDDYHDIIKARLEQLLETIRALCGESIEGRAFVDSGPVLERAFAGVAGLGWIGKNTHLISPQAGLVVFSGRAVCRSAVGLRPADARPLRPMRFVSQSLPDQRLCRTVCSRRAPLYFLLDHRAQGRHAACSLRPLVGNHIFGCDICQEVCPYNVKAQATAEAAFGPRSGLYAPQLIPLLSLTEAEFRQRFDGSPILRAKRRGFLRNVAVALGNLKCQEAVPALIAALDDVEPLVRGHAAWALGEIGSQPAVDALQHCLQIETDDAVCAEIEAALTRLSDPGTGS